MKEQFRKYAQRLSDVEKEALWRSIPKDPGNERRRRLQFYAGLGTSTVVVALMIVMGIVYMKRPGHMTGMDELGPAPETLTVAVDKQTGEIVLLNEEEVESLGRESFAAPKAAGDQERSPADSDRMMAAAPAQSEKVPTVASSEDAGRRGSAAAVPAAPVPAAPEAGAQAAASSRMMQEESAEAKPAPAPAPMKREASAEAKAAPGGALREAPASADARREERDAVAMVGRIYGRVIDSETGKPLAFANVVAKGTDFGAMSKEDGSFSFQVPCGEYTLLVAYIGYEVFRQEGVQACGGAPRPLEFALVLGVALQMDSIKVWGEAPAVDVKSSAVKRSEGSSEHRRPGADQLQESKGRDSGRIVRYQDLGVPPSVPGSARMRLDEKRETDREELYRRRLPRPRRHCWIPPGWNPPNGEAYDTVFFEDYGVNPFITSDEDPLSTFAVDVDNASYTIMRRYVGDGNLPPADAVRLEEYVNFFEQGYKAPVEDDFALYTDGAPSPFGEGYVLLRVGIKARELKESQRRPANLVFVVDTSGSMAREDRLELVKRALFLLLDELDEGDRVGIVEYGSTGHVVLEPTSLEERRRIERAVEGLYTSGSTNAEEGLMLGYEMASRLYDRGAINRLILCSDGVANTGATLAERILDRVRYESDRGIYLSTIGFGMGNYNDVLMEKLADQGDGNYYYVDDLDEARRVFVENLTGTLQAIARDAKVQVEFDPETVLRWRLLGYENRDVADEDFRDDRVDAGEIGAGHEVTALYEIKLAGEAERSDRPSRHERGWHLATVRLRYEKPELERRQAGQVVELERECTTGDVARDFDEANPRFKLDAVAAEFAEILRESFWARGSELGDLKPYLGGLDRELGDDEAVAEFIDLVRKAARIEASGERHERGERDER